MSESGGGSVKLSRNEGSFLYSHLLRLFYSSCGRVFYYRLFRGWLDVGHWVCFIGHCVVSSSQTVSSAVWLTSMTVHSLELGSFKSNRRCERWSFDMVHRWCCTFSLSAEPPESHATLATNWNGMCVFWTPWPILRACPDVSLSVTHHLDPSHSQSRWNHCGFSLWTSVWD